MSIHVAFMGYRMTLDNMTEDEMRQACIDLEKSILEKYGEEKGGTFILDIVFYNGGEYKKLKTFVKKVGKKQLKWMMHNMLWFDHYGEEYDPEEEDGLTFFRD